MESHHIPCHLTPLIRHLTPIPTSLPCLYKQIAATFKLVPALTRFLPSVVLLRSPTLTILHSPWRAGREPDTWAQQAPGMQLLGITGVPFLGIQDLGLEICARPCVLRDQQDGFPLHRTAPEHTANFPAGPNAQFSKRKQCSLGR